MGIVDRIKMNVRANLNYILDKAEDPQKVLDQLLLEMQGSVREFKEAVSTAIVGMKKLEHEISASAEKAAQWEQRTILALKHNDDELARKALEQKHIYAEKERSCREELEKQKQTVAELKASLSELEARLDELYKRRIEFIKQYTQLRKTSVQTSDARPVVSQLSIDTSAFDIYDRMVDKVVTLETQVEALQELLETDDLEEKFRKLERDTGIEAELKAMKDKLQSPQTQL